VVQCRSQCHVRGNIQRLESTGSEKGVPEALRGAVGKREEKLSFQTRDPVEAKLRHAEALTEIEKQWANLRAGPKSLTEREAHQLAITAYDNWFAKISRQSKPTYDV
jgi:hypothetical protein